MLVLVELSHGVVKELHGVAAGGAARNDDAEVVVLVLALLEDLVQLAKVLWGLEGAHATRILGGRGVEDLALALEGLDELGELRDLVKLSAMVTGDALQVALEFLREAPPRS